jgi:RNA polymerase sigma-54 factor
MAAADDLAQREEQRIGSLIIGNLNRDGYLDISVEELAANSQAARRHLGRSPGRHAEFRPGRGVRPRPAECLTDPGATLGLDNTIVTEIIQNHLQPPGKQELQSHLPALKKSLDEVIAAVNHHPMEPKPGRQFSDEMPQYITPDIYVYKPEDEFVIVLNDDGLPKLRVNSFYKQAISEGEKMSPRQRITFRTKCVRPPG